MDHPYPLRFKPVFRNYIWGGRRLHTVLKKELPDDGDVYAESWEVVDHGKDQSVVENGTLAGRTLAELVNSNGEWLLGRHHPAKQFPLLFKFLDCQKNLSVQVHPNDEQGSKLDPPDLGKTEAWVIMAATAGSCLYAGLQAGVDRATLAEHIRVGSVDQVLHKITPQVGDCVFIPAGTVHALGEGLLVAEIQQSSNTTFRLFDWNRVGADGKPRPLHIEQGLAVTDFERGPVHPIKPANAADNIERLVACEKFILDRITLNPGNEHVIADDNICHIIVSISGEFMIDGVPVQQGQSVLLPAAYGHATIRCGEQSKLLDMYLP